ncbi:alkaline phosphatase [soil metagenome]
MSGLSRRAVLTAGVSGLLLPSLTYDFEQAKKGRKPKNVIFMVADGMSVGTLSIADQFLFLTQNRRSFWQGLLADPNATRGFQETRSLNSLVTDSAAASSAWGSGRHVWNGAINAYPDGTELTPLCALLGEKQVRRGLVTTTSLTDATPAGFAVSHGTHEEEEAIALKLLRSGVEVLLGGGDRFFASDRRKDGRDLYADFARANYRVAKSRSELLAAPTGNLFGVFAPTNIPYAVDRAHSPELAAVMPPLPEMARIAVERLNGGREGFFLMIEGGRIDHGAHANDLAALVYDQIEFDETLRIAVDFALREKETLVIVTTDHGTANPGLRGGGDGLREAEQGLLALAGMKGSYESFLNSEPLNVSVYDAMVKGRQIGAAFDSLVPIIRDVLGIELTATEAAFVLDALNGRGAIKDAPKTSMLALALGNHTHVGWNGNEHTSDLAVLSAIGPGAEAFEGVWENTAIFDILLSFKGMKHENPSMTVEEAVRYKAPR